MPFGLLGGLLGGVADLGKIGLGIFQNIKGNEIHPQYTPYQVSPYAKKQLGIAEQLFGGRMFGASDLERNIAASQAGYQENVNRNATDASQALALGSLAQGATNQQYNQAGINQYQNKYNLLGNLNQGYQAMTAEGDKVYQDMLEKYRIDLQQKADLKEAAYKNIFGGVSDIAGGMIYGDQLGWFDNFGRRKKYKTEASAGDTYGGEFVD